MRFADILMAAATQGGGGAAGPSYGPELWPQPDFNASTGLTLNGWTFATGSITSPASAAFCTATALATLVAGTYHISLTIADDPIASNTRVKVGGTLSASLGNFDIPGTYTVDLVVASVSDQIIGIRDANGDGDVQVTALSVKQIL